MSKKAVYMISSGKLSRKQNTLIFEPQEGKKRYLPVETIREIHIFGEINLNKKLLEFLSKNEILLHFYNHYGYYAGSFYPREHNNSGFLILKQAEHYLDEEKRIKLARKFVIAAYKNMRQVLNYYENRCVNLRDKMDRLDNLGKGILSQRSIEGLMAIEGNIREVYYNAFDKIISSEDFKFNQRTRRPPKNYLNALISFGNSLIYAVTLSEIYKTHLDPRIGFLHTTNFRRFSLNLDVSEIFKPVLVDRLIFSLLNKGQIKAKHFLKDLNGIYLNEIGKKIFLEEWEKRLKTTVKHLTLKRKVSYRYLIRLELYKIEKHLIGDKEYEPFISRW